MSRQRTGALELRKGVWCVRVTLDDGRRERWSLGTSDKALAKRKAARLIAEIAAGHPPDDGGLGAKSERVDDYAEAYFAKREARKVVMVRDERINYRARIKRTIGKLYLCDVRPQHVASIIDDAIEAGLKRKTVVGIRALMHRILGEAWQAELIDVNPVDRVKVPPMREVRKDRVTLTDPEFCTFMACGKVSAEFKMMALASRTIGGMRASDLHKWDWTMLDTVAFTWADIPRSKTGKPDRLEVPEMVRPFLRAKWEAMGKPESGPVFPVEIGKHAGEFRQMRGDSHAERLRRALFRAGVVRMAPVQVPKVTKGQRTDLKRPTGETMPAPNPRDPLYFETATTMPVDFHSFRRAFSTALAEAGVNVQHAMHLTGHTSPSVHARYIMKTEAMRKVPAHAVPVLTAWPNGAESNRDKANQAESEDDNFPIDNTQTSSNCLQNGPQEGPHNPKVGGSNPPRATKKQGLAKAGPSHLSPHVAESPPPTPEVDPLEAALLCAARSGDSATVARLTEMMHARMLASSGVTTLDAARRKRQ